MALATYDDLKAAVADWLVRDDATSQIPDFIEMAEAEMNRQIQHWRMEETATLSVSTQYTALPSDFLAVEKATIGNNRLELASRAFIQEQTELTTGQTGEPTHYAITDGQLEVYPQPDTTYSVALVYREKVPALSVSVTTNWILDNYPDAYLYGALHHGSMWERDFASSEAWARKFGVAIGAMNEESNRGQMSGSGLRLKIASY